MDLVSKERGALDELDDFLRQTRQFDKFPEIIARVYKLGFGWSFARSSQPLL
jgi:hypothetical protein